MGRIRKPRLAPQILQHPLSRFRKRRQPAIVGGNSSRGDSGQGNEQRIQRLEAILLLAREPLSSRKLSQYANLADGTEARTLIRQLNHRYDNAPRPYRVEEVAGGFQILTRSPFAPWLRRLGHVQHQERLSPPALETLAVVSYRQPIQRADIEAIRGVACAEVLRQLMDRDLVRIAGRSRDLGRPYLYGTTNYFLRVFGLKSLHELPRAEFMKVVEPTNRTTSQEDHDREEEPTVTVFPATEEITNPTDPAQPQPADRSQPTDAPQLEQRAELEDEDFEDEEDEEWGEDDDEDEDWEEDDDDELDEDDLDEELEDDWEEVEDEDEEEDFEEEEEGEEEWDDEEGEEWGEEEEEEEEEEEY